MWWRWQARKCGTHKWQRKTWEAAPWRSLCEARMERWQHEDRTLGLPVSGCGGRYARHRKGQRIHVFRGSDTVLEGGLVISHTKGLLSKHGHSQDNPHFRNLFSQTKWKETVLVMSSQTACSSRHCEQNQQPGEKHFIIFRGLQLLRSRAFIT